MKGKNAKTITESFTEQVQIILSEHTNGYGRLFGGTLIQWIDIVAGVVAKRHSECNVTTACIDNLSFKAAAHLNDTILLKGQLTCIGKTSMEIRVDTFLEKLNGEHKHINRAYLVMVALDKNEKPISVPQIILTTDEEKLEFEAGIKRRALRKQRKKENF